ncbi:ATP-binding protein [Pelagibius sp.]|uniref:ATP-binding protein n=1 Tax=Pelagibius sp. TaxID=1931238 RepID=UPI003B509EC3
MSCSARQDLSEVDAAAHCLAVLPGFFRDKRETLVDLAIQVAKDYGYAQYTTTIRAAWIEAVDTLNECLATYLASEVAMILKPEAELDFQRDPRFTLLREVAKRHRSMGVTLQLYLGLFKHFRNLYLDILDDLPGETALATRARDRLQGFFDAAELSVGADWAEATEDERLMELQARARSVALDKDRYFSVFESLRDPAFLLNRQRRLLNANQAAAELFVGEANAGEIVYLTSMRGRRTPLEEVLRMAAPAGEGDDRSIWLDTRRGPMCFDLRERGIHDALDNTELGYVVILHDVTTHRRATEDAERARRAMSTFLATMSHEIRTPLHGVLGASELLRDADSECQGPYVDAIETAGRHLLQTLNKVLDFSRLESRPPKPTPQPCSLHTVLREYGHFASVWARRAKVPMTLSVARNLPRAVVIDWEMTQQVLTNLVSNAIRHDCGGGVTIAVRRRRSVQEQRFLRFEVLDNGPGILPGDAEMLFEPFGARSPGTASSSGAGLGLAISRRLIEAMGGSIGFRSRRAGGAAFWFDLPYGHLRNPAATGAVPGPEASDAMPKADHLCCLLVDDDQISRMVTADQLRRDGIAVTEAASVADALTCAEAGTFDIFVVDYHLADGDGAMLVSRLRSNLAKTAAPRFVALTANADMVEKACDGGHPFDALLAKPIAGADLTAAVRAPGPLPSPVPSGAQKLDTPCSLSELSPRVVDAMAEAFTAQWDSEIAKLRGAIERGDVSRLAEQAHRVASSCAVMGITDLAAMLRDLELECRYGPNQPDLPAWQARLDPQLRAAPGQARSLAAEIAG